MITQARAEQAAHDADILATQILTARGGNKKKLIQKRAGLLAVITRYNRQPVAAAPAPVAEKKTCCGGKCAKKEVASEQAAAAAKALADISEVKQLANIAEAQRVLDTLYSEIVQQAADMVNNGASEDVTNALDELLSTFAVYANDVDEDDIEDDEEEVEEEQTPLATVLRDLVDSIVTYSKERGLDPLSKEWNPKLYAGNKLFKVASVRIV